MPKAPKPRFNNFPEKEVFWAAGFFEGEGSVGERSLHVAQCNIWPLERLKRFFGGNFTTVRNDPRYNAQVLHQWFLCGPQGRDFVDAIYPHLSPKRQAQIDEKFLTWFKFTHRRTERTRVQRKLVDQAIASKDPVTGKFRPFTRVK